jgi:hypothetical protein
MAGWEDSLDLVRGSPMGTSIAEFGETVGEIQYTEPAPLAPGYQGGLYKAAGGEGSRGGNVIGHTSSGRPIYGNALHVSHATFNAAEHREAARLHDEEKRKKRQAGDRAQAKHHGKQWAAHTLAARREGLAKAKYTRREPKPGGGYRYFYDKPAGQKQSAAKDEPETAQGRVQAMFDKLDTSIKQVKHFTMNGRPVAVAMGQFGADAQREDFRNKHYIRVTVNGKDMATVGTPAEIAAWVARSPTMLDMLDPKGSVASTPRPKPSWER